MERYSSDHPALVALQVHAESCDLCVGREIIWKDLQNEPIEQAWFSATMQREYTFSGFAYMYLSYDLVLDGWLTLPDTPTATELSNLHNTCPEMSLLLSECLDAAQADGNSDVLPLIAKAEEFVDALRKAILFRFSEYEINWEQYSVESATYPNGYQLEYKGYEAEWEHDEDMRYFGRVTNAEVDIQFETFDLAQLEAKFRESVDAYLDRCRANRELPERPAS